MKRNWEKSLSLHNVSLHVLKNEMGTVISLTLKRGT